MININNSRSPQPGDKPKIRNGFLGLFGRKGRLICTLERAEVNGMIEARAHRRYDGWVAAIMAKYNLQRSDFWVDEKSCGLYYPN